MLDRTPRPATSRHDPVSGHDETKSPRRDEVGYAGDDDLTEKARLIIILMPDTDGRRARRGWAIAQKRRRLSSARSAPGIVSQAHP